LSHKRTEKQSGRQEGSDRNPFEHGKAPISEAAHNASGLCETHRWRCSVGF
jgi:hypothetical protein